MFFASVVVELADLYAAIALTIPLLMVIFEKTIKPQFR